MPALPGRSSGPRGAVTDPSGHEPVFGLGGREPHVLRPGEGQVAEAGRRSGPVVGQVGTEGFGKATEKGNLSHASLCSAELGPFL